MAVNANGDVIIRIIRQDGSLFCQMDSVIEWMKTLRDNTSDVDRKETLHQMIMMFIRCKNKKENNDKKENSRNE